MHTQLMIMADNYPNTNISGASFGSHDSSANANGNEIKFEASDFFDLNDWFEEVNIEGAFSSLSAGFNPHHLNYTPNEVVVDSSRISNSSFSEGALINNRDWGSGREQKEIREKVAFRTKSEIEILDDGFKWRKYGKKMVKNSPNPRNYYRCSVEGCPVKKRVERDKEDRRYVVTTYEGIHNHEGLDRSSGLLK